MAFFGDQIDFDIPASRNTSEFLHGSSKQSDGGDDIEKTLKIEVSRKNVSFATSFIHKKTILLSCKRSQLVHHIFRHTYIYIHTHTQNHN